MHILKKGQKIWSMFKRKRYFSSDVFRILKKVLELIIIQEEMIERKKKIKDDKSRAGVVVLFIYIAYLIFVIFLHRQNFWRIKFTPKNANFCQFFANFCQFTPKFAPKNANFCQFSPIFRVKSVKIYTG